MIICSTHRLKSILYNCFAFKEMKKIHIGTFHVYAKVDKNCSGLSPVNKLEVSKRFDNTGDFLAQK